MSKQRDKSCCLSLSLSLLSISILLITFFVFQNYQCNTKKYYSDAGCWTYQKSGHSECRLFCSLETCKRVHNPIPGICTVFNCTKKSSASVLLTTTSTSTTARPTSTTQSINQWSTETITKQPKFTLQDEYCDQVLGI